MQMRNRKNFYRTYKRLQNSREYLLYEAWDAQQGGLIPDTWVNGAGLPENTHVIMNPR